MKVCGIDPGISGAFAIFDTTYEDEIQIWDMPTVSILRNGKNKNEVSAALVATIIAGKNIDCAYLERVNAMPGQGVSSVFSFGRSVGILEGVIAAYEIPITIVTPQAWQKAMAVRGGKDGSRERAMELFPKSSDSFKLKKNDGRADATLIAMYGLQQQRK